MLSASASYTMLIASRLTGIASKSAHVMPYAAASFSSTNGRVRTFCRMAMRSTQPMRCAISYRSLVAAWYSVSSRWFSTVSNCVVRVCHSSAFFQRPTTFTISPSVACSGSQNSARRYTLLSASGACATMRPARGATPTRVPKRTEFIARAIDLVVARRQVRSRSRRRSASTPRRALAAGSSRDAMGTPMDVDGDSFDRRCSPHMQHLGPSPWPLRRPLRDRRGPDPVARWAAAAARSLQPPPLDASDFDLLHQCVRVELDFEREHLRGSNEMRLRVARGSTEVRLNASSQLRLLAISLDGAPLELSAASIARSTDDVVPRDKPRTRDLGSFRACHGAAVFASQDGELTIPLPPRLLAEAAARRDDDDPYAAADAAAADGDGGVEVTLLIEYEVVKPDGGVAFVRGGGGGASYAVTVGEEGSARRWFPCVDRLETLRGDAPRDRPRRPRRLRLGPSDWHVHHGRRHAGRARRFPSLMSSSTAGRRARAAAGRHADVRGARVAARVRRGEPRERRPPDPAGRPPRVGRVRCGRRRRAS